MKHLAFLTILAVTGCAGLSGGNGLPDGVNWAPTDGPFMIKGSRAKIEDWRCPPGYIMYSEHHAGGTYAECVSARSIRNIFNAPTF